MKKPANLKWKLLFLGLYGVVLLVWLYFDLPCVLRAFTGIPCITCGLSRAWLAALRLDLGSAFRQYPMFWSIPVLVLFFLLDGQLLPNRKVNIGILGAILGLMSLIWLARLFGFLGGLSPL